MVAMGGHQPFQSPPQSLARLLVLWWFSYLIVESNGKPEQQQQDKTPDTGAGHSKTDTPSDRRHRVLPEYTNPPSLTEYCTCSTSCVTTDLDCNFRRDTRLSLLAARGRPGRL